MKIFYSKQVEIADGHELVIPVNGADTGDIAVSELWVSGGGSYTVSVLKFPNPADPSEEDWEEIPSGIDMNEFKVVTSEDEYPDRVLFLISDAAKVKIAPAEGEDVELGIKILY